jgi:putative component of membrane protein insertase Oxa1/YidC/SpoIIIJ protein YidD
MSSLAARCALGAIRAYQRHLSPRKGFACALRAANGGRSCSSFGYRAIARCGLRKGLRLLRRRLDACGRQHRVGGGPLSYQRGSIDPGCDLSCDVGDIASGACEILDSCGGCGGCDSGWPRKRARKDKRKEQVNEANMAALRARVEAAKRRNAPPRE